MLTAEQTVVQHLPPYIQELLIQDVRLCLKDSPLVRPRTTGGMPMRVRVSAAGRLGWVGDGPKGSGARAAVKKLRRIGYRCTFIDLREENNV